MLKRLTLKCIDINTKYCPCLLADTNNCLSCSLLKGEEVCNCDWPGVCLYYERHWQKKQVCRIDGLISDRVELETSFIIKEQITADTVLLSIQVTENLAKEVDKPGAFVFLRRPADPQFFVFPVGIMQVKEDTIEVVIELVGPKSRKILENNNREIYVRGPYFNGIFGQPWIDNLASGQVVLIAGGIGQPPALPIVRKLIANGNKVSAILAPGKLGKIFISEELENLGVSLHSVFSMRRSGIELLVEKYIKTELAPDLLVSAGPDEQHYGVISAMKNVGKNIPMAATNNSIMCCGEGICGSCERELRDGKRIKACKAQLDYSELIT